MEVFSDGGQMMKANPGKQLEIAVDDQIYLRLPIRTKIITAQDDIIQIVQESTAGLIQTDDLVVVSEKVVAITQGRAFALDDINPTRLATFLSKFVYKSPYGIGLASPFTMELALREVGRVKIIFAAIVAAIGKLFGVRGLFYRLCGDKARAIDGPCDYTIPPYDNYAVLGPEDPDLVARQISATLGCACAVIDANDLGVNILGVSGPEVDLDLLMGLLQDNPLGQSNEQTPIGIIRLAEVGVAELVPGT